jgi:DNA polymerase I-like protein with 3'-5' exonuclease and polymerase domains
MTTRHFLLQRICIFADCTIDPDVDEEVGEVLRRRFNINLPQRRTMNESLEAVNCNHEILTLILQYRSMTP